MAETCAVEPQISIIIIISAFRHQGMSKQNRNRKSYIERQINRALICAWFKQVPIRFVGSEKCTI